MREGAERRAEPHVDPIAGPVVGPAIGAVIGPAGGAAAGLTPLQRLVAPGDHERIVRLFGAAAAAGPEADHADPTEDETDPEADLDWPAAIQLIRDAGGRIRQARAGAQEATRRAHTLVGRSAREAEAAEQRAHAAEAAAEAAERRAAQAEAALAAAEARTRRAEEEAVAARNAEAEARLWLRRLFACLKTEFEELAEPPAGRA